MNLILSTAASLMLVYSGMAGVEALLTRYATPEARAGLAPPEHVDNFNSLDAPPAAPD
jgi:hypothetical protein